MSTRHSFSLSNTKLLIPEAAFEHPHGRVDLAQIKRRLPQFEESSKRGNVGIVSHAHLDPAKLIWGLSIVGGTGIASVKYGVYLAFQERNGESVA